MSNILECLEKTAAERSYHSDRLNRLTNIQSASMAHSLSSLLFHVFGRIAAALICLMFNS